MIKKVLSLLGILLIGFFLGRLSVDQEQKPLDQKVEAKEVYKITEKDLGSSPNSIPKGFNFEEFRRLKGLEDKYKKLLSSSLNESIKIEKKDFNNDEAVAKFAEAYSNSEITEALEKTKINDFFKFLKKTTSTYNFEELPEFISGKYEGLITYNTGRTREMTLSININRSEASYTAILDTHAADSELSTTDMGSYRLLGKTRSNSLVLTGTGEKYHIFHLPRLGELAGHVYGSQKIGEYYHAGSFRLREAY